MKFSTLTIENFKGFKAAAVDLAANGPGVYFVKGVNKAEPRLGSNGAGKSSIWHALCWCLYGRTPDGLRNPDIKPWFAKGVPTVTVTIDNQKVKRTTNTNGLSLNGEQVGQEQVDTLLGMSFPVFTNTILLGQGRPLFFDLKPQDKMALFSDTLDLGRWDRRASYAGDQVREVEQSIFELTGRLQGVEGQRLQLREQSQRVAEASERWEAECSAKLKECEDKLTKTLLVVATVQGEVDKADLNYDGAETELRDLDRKAGDFERAAAALGSQEGAFRATCKHAEQEYARARSTLSKLGSGSQCPTCGQSLKGTSLEKHRKTLADQCAKLKARAESSMPAALVKARTKYTVDLERWTVARTRFKMISNKAKDKLDAYRQQLADLKAEVKRLEQQKKEYAAEGNPYRTQIKTLAKQTAQLQETREELQAQLDKLVRRRERTKFWVKGFRDVRLYVVEDVLQELTLSTEALLGAVGLEDWAISYAIERETKSGTTQQGLTVTILSPGLAKPVRWESWSGGEAQRLKLVGSLALSEVLLAHAGVCPNLEILDEPSRGMSTEGVYDLVDCLTQRAQDQGLNIYYTDHRVMQSANFRGTLTVEKDNRGSRIV